MRLSAGAAASLIFALLLPALCCAAGLTPTEMSLGWRITELEAKMRQIEQRAEQSSQRRVALADQLAAGATQAWRLETRLTSLEKRVGESEWWAIGQRLARLEESMRLAQTILGVVGVALVAQAVGTFWRAFMGRRNGENGRGH